MCFRRESCPRSSEVAGNRNEGGAAAYRLGIPSFRTHTACNRLGRSTRHCVCHKISMARDAISRRLTISRNNYSSSLPQLVLSHSEMVLLSSTLIERASAFVHNFSVIAAIGVITISLLLYDTYRVVSDPLRKIPGPFWARYTRLWEVYHVRKGHFHSLNVELHEKYGKLHRCSYRSS
jgi:hypothetical protein